MKTLLSIIAGPLFLASAAAYFYVKIKMRPRDPELDNYYWEFEDRHPQYARYTKFCRLTFVAVVISILLIFIAAVI